MLRNIKKNESKSSHMRFLCSQYFMSVVFVIMFFLLSFMLAHTFDKCDIILIYDHF